MPQCLERECELSKMDASREEVTDLAMSGLSWIIRRSIVRFKKNVLLRGKLSFRKIAKVLM